MEQIGEAAKLYVWAQIIGSIVLAPFCLYFFWRITKELFHK